MRLTSLRARALVLSVALAVAIVTSVLVTAYMVVATRMDMVAQGEAARLSRAAWESVHRSVNASLLSARRQGLTGKALTDAASVEFAATIPQRFGVAGGSLMDGQFAFYDQASSDPLRYYSTPDAVVEDEGARARAAADGRPHERHLGGNTALANMLGNPDLGLFVVHVPFDYPNGARWVMDVVYDPAREEETIGRIRTPMLFLSFAAVILTALLVQSMLAWALRLVRDLRVAADSIQAGDYHFRLPDEGNHEVADLARSLNALLDRLGRRADAQTRFVADASHELATPVAGIRGYVNILRGWGADDEAIRDEAIAAIDRESRRMARLTTQLLEVIRSEEVLELHSVRHDVNQVVRSALLLVEAHYPDKGLTFVGPDPVPMVVMGDPERIEDVLSILLDNAAKYTPSGGRIEVRTARRRGDVLIEVSDSGKGISPDDLPNIFDRFYRSDESRGEDHAGFGLGLSIAKRIVESSGGLIDVLSTDGKGTTFTIRLPRGRD